MIRPFLTLNIPGRGLAAGTPVVATENPILLRLFKRLVLSEWEQRTSSAVDETLAEVDRLELQKLRATLDLLVPDRIDPTQTDSGATHL